MIYHCGGSATDNPGCKDAATAVEDYSANRNKHKYLQSVLQQSESLVGGDGEHVAASTNIGNSVLTLCLYNNIIYLLIPRPLFLLKITNLKKNVNV